ncbi:MAG: type II toxin-antitoxin system RelE/ParE family toxin [Gallionellaceae bacterium]|nr:MAG: type II toxin-antitoxin system RelE/ParE family toxin [Gallionellaceae bacterium]
MKIEFLPEADEELREAARYYESEAAGVGLSFIAAVHKAVDEIAELPLAAQVQRAGIRKKVLRHFAYNLFYALESDIIVIVAVAHQRKRPNYWRSRLKLRSSGGQ